MDRARRRELKHAGVLAARQARVDLAATIAALESSTTAGDEGRALAGRLSFAVGALFGAEVGEPEGVRDRLREASGVLSGVLARLSEPGVPRALDDAGASIAKCLALLYPARAGLERELEASASMEASAVGAPPSDTAIDPSAPVVEIPARPGGQEWRSAEAPTSKPTSPGFASMGASEEAAEGRTKKSTSPGLGPPGAIEDSPERPARGVKRTPIRGTDPLPERAAVRASAPTLPAPEPSEDDERHAETKISRPPPALLREATPQEASTFVGKTASLRPSDPPVPLQKRSRKKALELVPDADEGLVERQSRSPLVERVDRGAERRTASRVMLDADIGLHSATQFFTGLTGDISHGGLFVATWKPLPLGTEVTVSFVLPGGHQVTALGRVAWLKEQGDAEGTEGTPGMGVRFTMLSVEDRRAIETFLARRPAMFHEV
jgi:uncharacterized protein (TIGR02266 family)